MSVYENASHYSCFGEWRQMGGGKWPGFSGNLESQRETAPDGGAVNDWRVPVERVQNVYFAVTMKLRGAPKTLPPVFQPRPW